MRTSGAFRWLPLLLLAAAVCLCAAQRGSELKVASRAPCTTLACCRAQYVLSHHALDWCVIDVAVDASGEGCVDIERCPGQSCSAVTRQCTEAAAARKVDVVVASGGRSIDACTQDVHCSDGYFCNGQEVCNRARGGNTCGPSFYGNPCAAAGTHCVEAGGGGGHCARLCATDRDCDDGVFCNGRETCAPAPLEPATRICQPATGAAATPCAPGELCDERVGACVAPCNGSAGACDISALVQHCDYFEGVPVSCPLDQACDPLVGCVECTPETAAFFCDDHDACTVDSCAAGNVCRHEPACPAGHVCVAATRQCQVPCDATWCNRCDGYQCDALTNACVAVGAPLVCSGAGEVCDAVAQACRPLRCARDADCPNNERFCDGVYRCDLATHWCRFNATVCPERGALCVESRRACNRVCATDADCANNAADFCEPYSPCDPVLDRCLVERPRCGPNATCNSWLKTCRAASGRSAAAGTASTPAAGAAAVNTSAVFKWVAIVSLFVILCFVFTVIIVWMAGPIRAPR